MSFDQTAGAPAGTAKSAPKLSPKLMRIVIQSLQELPNLARAAAKAGIHRKTLEYWIKRSRAGDDGYDVEWEGVLWRFHNHCEVAMGAQFDKLLGIVWQRAMGVVFKVDPFLVDLGYRGYEAYARDKNGNLIIETRGRPNGKMIRYFLEMVRPWKWGDPAKIKAPRRRFILGIDDLCPEDGASRADPVRQWKAWKRKIRDAKD